MLFRQVFLIILFYLKVVLCYNNYCLEIVYSADKLIIIKKAYISLKYNQVRVIVLSF
jgi:hypothetical protein